MGYGRRGPSSFNKLDSALAFREMGLKNGDAFADLGCGAGDYSLYACSITGAEGKVYAVDISEDMISGLREEIRRRNLCNIIAVESDICNSIRLSDDSVDCCLLATVMHAAKLMGNDKNLFPEIMRILRPGGCLAIIECKKEETFFGPPLSMRISPEELDGAVSPYGFKKKKCVDLGYYYMMLFSY
jgi:ubiquinone/menaquinone biosynthesis C-methylase UbiE